MANWKDVHGILIRVPQLTDMVALDTVDNFVRAQGIRSVPPLHECKTPGNYVERLGLGRAQDLDAELGRQFVDGMALGWQYTPATEELRQWDKECAELKRWRHYEVPAEKASVAEKKRVTSAALTIAREERDAALTRVANEMVAGMDPAQWKQYIVDRIKPFDHTVIALRSLEQALDSLAEPNNQERREALASIKLARDRLEIIERQISMYWAERFFKFENGIRERLGLNPIKKNANKDKTKQEVSIA